MRVRKREKFDRANQRVHQKIRCVGVEVFKKRVRVRIKKFQVINQVKKIAWEVLDKKKEVQVNHTRKRQVSTNKKRKPIKIHSLSKTTTPDKSNQDSNILLLKVKKII